MDRLLLATLAICVLTLGAWTMAQEATQYLVGGTRVQRVAANSPLPPFTGLSLATRQENLADCAFALRREASLEVRYISAEFRAGLPARCAAMARESVALMPTFSYGWYILAYTDALASDWAALSAHLALSQATGKDSQWIAEQRVALAETNRPQLDTQALAANDADLALLVRSLRGVSTIATRYIQDPAFRERITAIVETMPQDVQARFVGALQYQTR